jgi:hypothetical protein
LIKPGIINPFCFSFLPKAARDESRQPTSSPVALHTSKDHVEPQSDDPNPANSYPHGTEEVEWNLKRSTEAPSKEGTSMYNVCFSIPPFVDIKLTPFFFFVRPLRKFCA